MRRTISAFQVSLGDDIPGSLGVWGPSSGRRAGSAVPKQIREVGSSLTGKQLFKLAKRFLFPLYFRQLRMKKGPKERLGQVRALLGSG